jgi:hypothetical protein
VSASYLRKFVIDEACSRQREPLIALAKLKSHGITSDRIIQLNNLLQNIKPSSLVEPVHKTIIAFFATEIIYGNPDMTLGE